MANRNVFTVTQFCERNPAWTTSAMRDYIYHSKPRHTSRGEIPGNGFGSAIIRVSPNGAGRGRLLIDEDRWFEILEKNRQEQTGENGRAVRQPSDVRTAQTTA
jgi:hypothetical protein